MSLPPRLEDRKWLFWVKDRPVERGAIFHGKTHHVASEKAAVHFGVERLQLDWRPAWKEPR